MKIQLIYFLLLVTLSKSEKLFQDLSQYNRNKLWIVDDVCYAISFTENNFYGLNTYHKNDEIVKKCKTLMIYNFHQLQCKQNSLDSVEKLIVFASKQIFSSSFANAKIKEYFFYSETEFSPNAFKTEKEYISNECDEEEMLIDNFSYCGGSKELSTNVIEDLFECVKIDNFNWNNLTICGTMEIQFNKNESKLSISGYGGIERKHVELYENSIIRTIELKEGITSIGKNAFENFNAFEIILPKTLITIEKYSFINMKNLQKLTFPPLVGSFRISSIVSCSSLEKIVFSNPHQTKFEDINFISMVKSAKLKIYSCAETISSVENTTTLTVYTQKNANCQFNIHCEDFGEIDECPIVESLYIPFDCEYDLLSLIVGNIIGFLLTGFLIFAIKCTDKICETNSCQKCYEDHCECFCFSIQFLITMFLCCFDSCFNVDHHDFDEEQKRKRKFAMKLVFYTILTICVLFGPVISFIIDIVNEDYKPSSEESQTNIILEFVANIFFFLVTWCWFTVRFCCTCYPLKKRLNENVHGLCHCSDCKKWLSHVMILLVCLFVVIIVIGIVGFSIFLKGYFIYQHIDGTAINVENVVCAIISGKEGYEINQRQIIDDISDIANETSEAFQTLNIILLIVIIISFFIMRCRKNCCCKYFCCCFCCICETTCCQKCLEWLIDIGVEESFGNELKNKMYLEDVPSIEMDD